MTLLRNDLRSEDKSRPQTGWLDNIIPKKPKETTEGEAASKPKAIRETPISAPIPATPEENSGLEPRVKPQSRVAPAATIPSARPARLEPAPAHLGADSAESESPADGKISILGVVAGVSFALFSTLSLAQGQQGWLGAVVFVTVALLASSILGSWYRHGVQKAFWRGFAVFGLAYLGMAFVPIFPHEAGLEVPTARLIRVVHAKVTGTPEDARNSFQIMKALPVAAEATAKPLFGEEASETKPPAPQTASLLSPGDVRQFTVVGQCFFTIAFALLGSALARWFYRSSLAA